MTLVDAPATSPRAPSSATRLRWLVPALLVALLAGIAGWAWLAHHPRVEQGTSSRPVDLRTVGDGFVDTRYVVPPGGGQLFVSVRNTGPLPVTLSAATPPYPEDAFLTVEGLRPGAAGVLRDPQPAWRDRLRLAPEEQATLWLRLAQARCVPSGAGGATTLTHVPLRLSWLGVTTVAEHPLLPLPVTFPGPHTPPADCA